jgi:hypothetical protein
MADIMIPKITFPGPNDLGYGRDSFAQQQHLGNSHFIFLIESRREEHGRAEADLETLPGNERHVEG